MEIKMLLFEMKYFQFWREKENSHTPECTEAKMDWLSSCQLGNRKIPVFPFGANP